MNIRKVIGAGVATVAIAVAATACSATTSNGNSAESQQQQRITTNLESSQPLPAVFYSQERQNLIDIEMAEVNDVRTTSFVVDFGHLQYSCPSIGFGIPDSASLSNPLQVGYGYSSWGGNSYYDSGVVDQMDPNGIYAPASSAGTWTICLDKFGTPYISRFESNVNTVGGPAYWDAKAYAAGEQPIVSTGAPTAVAKAGNGRDARNTHAQSGLAAGGGSGQTVSSAKS